MKKSQKLYLPLKRLIGIIGSFVGILFCTVFLWWWAIPINVIVTKGHPFFARHRIGKDGKEFRCLKFRSMRLEANPHMTSREEAARQELTGFGKFLRKSSIDETLQLFNIFVGQMAFIGPRPLINTGDDKITIALREENGAYHLRPGLSGFAQIHKRGALDPQTKAKYDGEYYKCISLWLDITIFVYTVFKIFGVAKGR